MRRADRPSRPVRLRRLLVMTAFPSPRTALLLVLALVPAADAHAFTVAISRLNNGQELYLRVGDGAFSNNTYSSNGTPGTGGAVNVVSASVPGAVLGNGTDQPMAGASRVTSDYDGFAFCNAGQTYVGGFFRGRNNAGTATLTAYVTLPLSNGAETIPFSQIRWAANGNISGGGSEGSVGQPIPDNNFGDTAKVLAGFPVNSWRESCHSFFYGNDAVVAAGTYRGRITYTLSAP